MQTKYTDLCMIVAEDGANANARTVRPRRSKEATRDTPEEDTRAGATAKG